MNAIGVDELFARYEEAGFLYPEKLKRLAPVLPRVKENWSRALEADGDLHHIVTYHDEEHGRWGSISSWRNAFHGWVTQHLVAVGGPAASQAVMLAEQAVSKRQIDPTPDSV